MVIQKPDEMRFHATETESVSTIHRASAADIPKVVELLELVHAEAQTSLEFDASHAWEHVTGIVCNGVSFLATMNNETIGVVMCGYVDVAYAMTKALETHHLYVLPIARSSGAASQLLDAVEALANEQDTVAIFHQMDYHSALYGSANNSRVVERWFKSRGYEGPVDSANVGRDGQRVGVSYRYRPDSKDHVVRPEEV